MEIADTHPHEVVKIDSSQEVATLAFMLSCRAWHVQSFGSQRMR